MLRLKRKVHLMPNTKEIYTIEQIYDAAATLFEDKLPGGNSEYERGVTEIISRLRADNNIGEGTGENMPETIAQINRRIED
jgi:hypothetical protein